MKNHDSFDQKSNDLHDRIVQGDVTASVELAELVLEVLTIGLTKQFPRIFDPDLIDSAVTDAIIKYFGNPKKFRPDERSLVGYLFMSARGDLLNYLSPRKLDEKSIALAEDVELWDVYAEKNIYSVLVTDDVDVEEEALSRFSPLTSEIEKLFPNSKDRELVAMMMSGIRDTEEYSRVLGIDSLSLVEQKKIVKKHKDRIKKAITRNIAPKELKDDY